MLHTYVRFQRATDKQQRFVYLGFVESATTDLSKSYKLFSKSMELLELFILSCVYSYACQLVWAFLTRLPH